MKKRVKVLSFFLALVLCFGSVTSVYATDLDEAKDKKEKLQEDKKELQQKKASLKNQLSKIAADMKKASEKLEKKQLEIAETQDELDVAKIEEREQYANMKLRIQFMYESGNSDMIELLMESKNISDLLNKAEYIKQTSDYDRQKLVEFQDTVKKIQKTEKKLAKEEKELQKLQKSLLSKKKEVNGLLKKANLDLASLEKELGATQKTIDDLIEQARKAQQQQQQQNNSRPSNSGTAGADKIIGNGELAWPTTSKRVTSRFGWRPVPVAGATSWHDAIDIGAPIGTPVYSAKAGTVITASWGYNGGRGNYVMVDHGSGLVTRYQHLSDIYVKVGQKVNKGQNIAAVGNTGASSGPHLDYAIYVNGSAVDPLRYY